MTKVSVIIPYQNVEQYIGKCLASVCAQTLQDLQIICVNDFSTDASIDIVEKFAKNDRRITMINSDKPLGQSYARNLALKIATGEYIGFVDSDDWIDFSMFEKLYNLAKSDNTDITMCKSQLFDDKTLEISTDDYYSLKIFEKFQNNSFSASDVKDDILNINVVIWNKIYKNEFLKEFNINFPDGFIYEDLPFSFNTFIQAKKINVLWENMYFYRQNRSYSTMQKTDKKVFDRIPMVELTYSILKKLPYFEEKKIDILSWMIDDIFHRYTLVENQYYENYYAKMKEFFQRLNISEEDKIKLTSCYCYDEFCNILNLDYLGFWTFLIEKYKTANKRIKAYEHKCNLDIQAIKHYWEQKQLEYLEQIYTLKNELINTEATLKKETIKIKTDFEKQITDIQTDLNKKIEYETEIKQLTQNDLNEQIKLTENCKHLIDNLKQEKLKLENEYNLKLEEFKKQNAIALFEQKKYYENHYLSVKIILKLCKTTEQLKNKVNKFLKKN